MGCAEKGCLQQNAAQETQSSNKLGVKPHLFRNYTAYLGSVKPAADSISLSVANFNSPTVVNKDPQKKHLLKYAKVIEQTFAVNTVSNELRNMLNLKNILNIFRKQCKNIRKNYALYHILPKLPFWHQR